MENLLLLILIIVIFLAIYWFYIKLDDENIKQKNFYREEPFNNQKKIKKNKKVNFDLDELESFTQTNITQDSITIGSLMNYVKSENSDI
jgi:hypothetical protein